MGWLDEIAQIAAAKGMKPVDVMTGGMFGGPTSLELHKRALADNPLLSKYVTGLSDAELAPSAFNPMNPWEPINPSGQLRLPLGDYRFEEGEEGMIDWLQQMARAQRTGSPEFVASQRRAWEQDYTPDNLLHYTDKTFPKFDLGFASTGANAGQLKKERALFGVRGDDAPEVGETYIPRPVKGPAWQQPQGGQVWAYRLRGLGDYATYDMAGGLYDRDVVWDQLADAQKQKAPGVVFKDMRDPGPYWDPKKNLPSGRLPWDQFGNISDEAIQNFPAADIIATFDLSRIRSPWARFDPRRQGEADPLAGWAGLAGAGALGAAAVAGSGGEAEAGWLTGLQQMGKVPHVPAAKGPYQFGQAFTADKSLIGRPDEGAIYPSGRLYWPHRGGAYAERQNEQLLDPIWDTYERAAITGEAKKRGRDIWDIVTGGGPGYAEDLLRKGGFSGVGHGPFLDPTGATMLDPLHMRSGEAAWRQALADAQNYHPSQMYHSGMVPFEQIDLGRASTGANKGVPMAIDKERAFFLGPNPAQSASYLEQTPAMLPWTPEMVKQYGFDLSDPNNIDPIAQSLLRGREGGYKEGSHTMPLRLRGTEDFFLQDMGGDPFSRQVVWPALEHAQNAGFPGVRFKDMRDEGPWPVDLPGYPGSDDPSDVYAVFQRGLNRVRSANALFDPKRAHEADLGASWAGLALGGGALGAATLSGGDAEARPSIPRPTSLPPPSGDRPLPPDLPRRGDPISSAFGAVPAAEQRPAWAQSTLPDIPPGRIADAFRTFEPSQLAKGDRLPGPPEPTAIMRAMGDMRTRGYEQARSWDEMPPAGRPTVQGAEFPPDPYSIAELLKRGYNASPWYNLADAPFNLAVSTVESMIEHGRNWRKMMSGEIEPGSRAESDEIASLALDFGLGGLGRAAVAPRLAPGEAEAGAFGSRRLARRGGGPAEGKGLAPMHEAEARLMAATNPDEFERIRQETGWFMTPGRNPVPPLPGGPALAHTFPNNSGPDLRYEMSDEGSRLKLPSAWGTGAGQQDYISAGLGDIADFPELFRQWPEMKTLPVEMFARPGPSGAQYRYPYPPGAAGMLPPTFAIGPDLGSIKVWDAKDDMQTLSRLMHEGPGHALDFYSGHPVGGSMYDPGYFYKGGEVSARDLQHRLGLSDLEKWFTPPALSRAHAEGYSVDEVLPFLYRDEALFGSQGQYKPVWRKPVDPQTQQARLAEAQQSGQMPPVPKWNGPGDPEFMRVVAIRTEIKRRALHGEPFPWEPGGEPMGVP